MRSPDDALARLREGNARFAERPDLSTWTLEGFRPERVASGQSPFAVVIGCSDSRVPVEVVFQQAPGDLFVVRVAGNVASPEVVGSVEFACGRLGTRLVLVLGHSGCGAVAAALESGLTSPPESPNLRAIVGAVAAAIEGETEPMRAVEANVRATMDALLCDSALLAELAEADLRVVGAVYELESGRVRFL